MGYQEALTLQSEGVIGGDMALGKTSELTNCFLVVSSETGGIWSVKRFAGTMTLQQLRMRQI